MNPMPRVLLLCSFLCLSWFLSSPNAQQPRAPASQEQLLNQGLRAYQRGRFEQAVRLFESAVAAGPGYVKARLYLAAAYAAQYVPGVAGEENARNGEKALEQFREALKLEPENLSALDGAGTVLFQMAAGANAWRGLLEESREHFRRRLALEPKNAETHYWIGVINWTLASRTSAEIRRAWKLRDDEELPFAARREFAEREGPDVEEGVQHLLRALELRPGYEDAQACLSLAYRQKADLADTPSERAELLRKADNLVEQLVKAKAGKTLEDRPRRTP